MTYLSWKKKTRRTCEVFKKEKPLKSLRLVLPKQFENGPLVNCTKHKVVVPFDAMKNLKTKLGHQHQMDDITMSVFCHEIGHYLEYRTNTKKEKEKLKRLAYLQDKITFALTKNEREGAFAEYKEILLENEYLAWHTGERYYQGSADTFMATKERALQSYLKIKVWSIEDMLRGVRTSAF